MNPHPGLKTSSLQLHHDQHTCSMSVCGATVDPTPGPPAAGLGRPPLAEKALSEAFPQVRYRDTSLLIWQQQQQNLQAAPPPDLPEPQPVDLVQQLREPGRGGPGQEGPAGGQLQDLQPHVKA
ncbi:hypothetical protein PBY51_004653 [Eleginops maclovinus]|uniref:Uncharacterized protein n=1 Tax=Eleginops maclovinus TaxID=56733 RepID=A0AAN7Y371_ELEMC|nr:hypothetical protein PBY51_004653 [Eleginops maclovinus]